MGIEYNEQDAEILVESCSQVGEVFRSYELRMAMTAKSPDGGYSTEEVNYALEMLEDRERVDVEGVKRDALGNHTWVRNEDLDEEHVKELLVEPESEIEEGGSFLDALV